MHHCPKLSYVARLERDLDLLPKLFDKIETLNHLPVALFGTLLLFRQEIAGTSRPTPPPTKDSPAADERIATTVQLADAPSPALPSGEKGTAGEERFAATMQFQEPLIPVLSPSAKGTADEDDIAKTMFMAMSRPQSGDNPEAEQTG